MSLSGQFYQNTRWVCEQYMRIYFIILNLKHQLVWNEIWEGPKVVLRISIQIELVFMTEIILVFYLQMNFQML